MWGCYVNSLRALSSLQATVTNFAMNFLSSGLAGFFLFGETLSTKVKEKVSFLKIVFIRCSLSFIDICWTTMLGLFLLHGLIMMY